ncbi:MAG: non-canonical purine NTP pyrophosphatase [Clostridiales bacterium]|nr:non-canonical purine NTP pyrophosphatase [Clostridiales bacterium]
MKVIFATTNNRKLEDLNNIIFENNLDLQVLSLADIGWDRGEIEENGNSIYENSLIKANAVLDFCKENNITYPIITDDAGLFVDALNGEPGIYTARYADAELKQNPDLPKHYVIIKMLNNMLEQTNRECEYRCAITVMFSDGNYEVFDGITKGLIDTKINEPIKKPYFYSLFIDAECQIPFNHLTTEQLKTTYRYTALSKALKFLDLEKKKREEIENIVNQKEQ